MRLRRDDGALTAREKAFTQVMARTNDAEYAAAKAGYAHPPSAASRLTRNEHVMGATRAETQRVLRDEIPDFVLTRMMRLADDEKNPAGARHQALKTLGDWADIGLKGEAGGKDPSEMDGNELHALIDKLNRQRDMIEHALAGKAIDVTPKPGVFE